MKKRNKIILIIIGIIVGLLLIHLSVNYILPFVQSLHSSDGVNQF